MDDSINNQNQNNEAPEVTVGIPYHKNTSLSYLKVSIDSILNQTLKPVSIHLIQDGSVGQELTQLINSYINQYSICKEIKINENKGLPYAINYSILNSDSQYYVRMDDDDISAPERLEKQISFLEENPEIDILGSWAYEFKGETPDEGSIFLKKLPTGKKDIHRFFHYRSPFIHPSVVFRRSVFAKIGLYNTKYKSSQDVELWSRALKHNVGVANLPESLLYYRATYLSEKRRDIPSVFRIAKAQFSYNTYSPYLNILKLASIGFRLFPLSLRKWGYENLRSKNSRNPKKVIQNDKSVDV